MIALRALGDSTYLVVDRQDLTDLASLPPAERGIFESPWLWSIECRPFPRGPEAAAILPWLQEVNEAQKALERELRDELHETQKAWKGLPEETRRLLRRSSRTEIRFVYADYRELPPEGDSGGETVASIGCHIYLKENQR